jgi:SEC-C motif/Nuclease-related domain
MRKESEIFSELADVCASPGYVHAIAYFCFRDNTIKYTADSVTPDDVLQQFSLDRLVRTEISTLIGLACKVDINTALPSPDVMQSFIDKTDALLKEIHQSMLPSMVDIFDPERLGDENFNPFKNGLALRESIFYGGEAAYHFQYRDLSKIKYKKDNDWFEKNKGYSIQQVFDVVTAIQLLHVDKINHVLQDLVNRDPNDWSILPAFKFTADEVNNNSKIKIDTVRLVIESFVSSIHMTDFKSLDDFNPINAYPIIKLPNAEYLLFQNYSLVEALYETPFFWFNDDKKYQPIAMQHRGEFAEEFSAERLQLVFGTKRVFLNVDIYDSKKNRVGEIDVLVVFANRAIILQAKSKKLTIAARKGNDNSLQEDFKKAVQEAYDQAFSCATFLTDKAYKLTDQSGNRLDINRKYKEIYPFCVVSDHYPALSFQARQFLNFKETEIIKPPFVMDVFLLDVMTEMLRSPLYFLNYINRRTYYGDKILSTHELTILSYHLKQNLWLNDNFGMMHLTDDICADLDLAMLTRRDGVLGIETPPGILTKYKNTAFDHIINDIEQLEHHATIDLGFMLLTLGSESVQMINDGISKLISLGKKDNQHHDLTLGFNTESTGLTIHCNDDEIPISTHRLKSHCERRKYAEKANSWFGICIGQTNPRLRFGVNKQYNWEQSDEMDEIVKDMPKPQNLKGKNKINFNTITRKSKKTGRNDKCPCGSGKKYKQCCLNIAL